MADDVTPDSKPVETVPLEKFHNLQAKFVDLEKKFDRVKDIDPDAFKAIKEDYDSMRKAAALNDPTKVDALLASKEKDVRTALQKDIDGLTSTLGQTQSELKELRVTDHVFSLAANKFNDDTHDDVKSSIRKYCDIGDDGKIYVKDEAGKIRYAKGSATEPMGVDEFVGWLAEKKPSWAKSTAQPGTKQPGHKSASIGAPQITKDILKDPAKLQQLAQTPEGVRAIEALFHR